MNTSQSGDASTQVCLFERLMLVSHSTSKTVTLDTQSLTNKTFIEQLAAIGERLDKTEERKVKKTPGPHKY